jgi:hypothetical protein
VLVIRSKAVCSDISKETVELTKFCNLPVGKMQDKPVSEDCPIDGEKLRFPGYAFADGNHTRNQR